MSTPVTTLGPGELIPLTRRVLLLPVLVLVLSLELVALTQKSGWLSIGGALVAALVSLCPGCRLVLRTQTQSLSFCLRLDLQWSTHST